jgi:hypothetical protein
MGTGTKRTSTNAASKEPKLQKQENGPEPTPASSEPKASSPNKLSGSDGLPPLSLAQKQSLARLTALLSLDKHSQSSALPGDLSGMLHILKRHSSTTSRDPVDKCIVNLVDEMQRHGVLARCGFNLQFLKEQKQNCRNLRICSNFSTVITKGSCTKVKSDDYNLVKDAVAWAHDAREQHLAVHNVVGHVMQAAKSLQTPAMPKTMEGVLEQTRVELQAGGSTAGTLNDKTWRYCVRSLSNPL